MALATNHSSLFPKIAFFLLLLLIGTSSILAQLKLELNFGENDNFHALARTGKDRLDLTSLQSEQGVFDVGGLINPSPAGGDYLILNGINQFLKLPTYLDINLNGHVSYSVSCWIYLHSTGVNGEIINADNGFVSGYRFFIEDNVPKLEISEGQKEVFASGVTIEPATWTHVGFFCDGAGDSVLFYINGEPSETFRFERITQTNTGQNSYVGASVKNVQPNYLKAHIDQLRFFAGHDTVFDQIEINIKRPSSKKQRSSYYNAFALDQNYPNPFNLSTKIRFELRKSGYVVLSVYDLLGNLVRVLEDAEKEEGMHEYFWDGSDSRGSTVTSGIYFVRLSFDGLIQTKKMILVK